MARIPKKAWSYFMISYHIPVEVFVLKSACFRPPVHYSTKFWLNKVHIFLLCFLLRHLFGSRCRWSVLHLMQNGILWLWSQVWRLGSLRIEPYCIWALYPPQSMVNSMSALGNDINPWCCHRKSTFCVLTCLRHFANMEATPRSLKIFVFVTCIWSILSDTEFPIMTLSRLYFLQQESWLGRWGVRGNDAANS